MRLSYTYFPKHCISRAFLGNYNTSRWRLRDNYSRFFLKYIEPSAGAIDSGAFEITGLDTLEGIDSIFGLAFENLVVNHVRDLLPLLNLRGALVLSAAPYQR